jgi:hypothetical protein
VPAHAPARAARAPPVPGPWRARELGPYRPIPTHSQALARPEPPVPLCSSAPALTPTPPPPNRYAAGSPIVLDAARMPKAPPKDEGEIAFVESMHRVSDGPGPRALRACHALSWRAPSARFRR